MVQKGLKALNHFQEPLEALRSSSLSLVDTARSSVWICTWEWQNLHLRMTMADGRPNRAPGATGYSSYFHHQRGLPAYIFLPLLQLSEIKLSTVFPSCGFFPRPRRALFPVFHLYEAIFNNVWKSATETWKNVNLDINLTSYSRWNCT